MPTHPGKRIRELLEDQRPGAAQGGQGPAASPMMGRGPGGEGPREQAAGPGGEPTTGQPDADTGPPERPSEGYEDLEEFVSDFEDQFADMDRQAQQRAMDAYNGAVFEGAPVEEAIRMAVGAAKSFAGGQETGRSPAVRT